MTYPADRFVDELLAAGFDWFGGVPCSLIAPVIAELEKRKLYLGDTREDAALGAAAGAYMAGRQPMVLMQNSGLGVSLNALGSLHQLYEMPVLVFVTWRGFDGHDAPEHIVMGDVLPRLLDLFEIPWRAPDHAGLAGDVVWAADLMRATRKPVAIVVKPGLFAEHK